MIIEGDIVIIDFDREDSEILNRIFIDLGYKNKLLFFDDSTDAFEYLALPQSWPFIIFCEINMPKVDGYELRQMIIHDPVINLKSIPFIYFTSIKSNESTVQAYKGFIQGYFRKENSYERYRETVSAIMKYWTSSITPEH